MKKLLLLLCLALTLGACEGPEGPMGQSGSNGANGQNGKDGQNGQNGIDGSPGSPGEPGKDGTGTKWESLSISIKEADWKLLGVEGDYDSRYFVTVDVPQLTQYIYKYGTVLCYIQGENANQKRGLPLVLHKGVPDNNNNDYLWTETYDYEFSPNEVTFNVTYSDFKTQFAQPGNETFHLVLMWD